MAQQWWKTMEQYQNSSPMPNEFDRFSGPAGPALVRAWDNGKTDRGWGLKPTDKSPGFIPKYRSGGFRAAPVLAGFEAGRWNFAFVMRSLRLVCIDIDGKNGGMLHAGRLGLLPRTLAETSKSGDGLHLFYATSDDQWDDATGYAGYSDRIGLETGVDFRAVGCVYHYPQQRWNGELIAELPDHLKQRLHAAAAAPSTTVEGIIAYLQTADDMEVALMHDNLITDLNKPIPDGRRNNTLFAIGSQMYAAQIIGWETLLRTRADEVGLDPEEIDKLVTNITKYGATA
jgi:hypothetical protein